MTCWYHLISLFLGRNVVFVCCLHKSHIHLSWGEIWINFDACHVFGEIAINVSTLLFSIFIVFHNDTQTYDFILRITWRIYDIIFLNDVSFEAVYFDSSLTSSKFMYSYIHILPLFDDDNHYQVNSFRHHQNLHDLHSPPFWWWQPLSKAWSSWHHQNLHDLHSPPFWWWQPPVG